MAKEVSSKKKRIFIAIGAGDELKREILKWQSSHNDKLDERIRWIRLEDLHITLIPPWYEEDVEGVNTRLTDKIHGRTPFKIKFDNISYGPDPKRPRLIWLSGKAPIEIRELKTEAESALGAKPEKKPFLLHLTIARFKEEYFSSFQTKEINESIAWTDTVKAIRVMESNLARSGATYEVLREINI